MAKHKGIYQRGEVYWIRYTGVDGKQCRESTKSDKLKDAQDLLKLRQADVVRGEQPDVIKIKNHTFRELAERYLDYCSNQRNFANKRYMINNLVLDFGNVPLKNFSLLLLEKYQARLLSENRKPLKGTDTPRPPIEQATVNRRIATIKAMFTKALDWNMVSEAVYKQVHKVKMFRETITRDAFLSRDKIKALLDACDEQVTTRTGRKIGLKQSHLKPIIIFALNTGCRKEEILSLKWEQVDLVHGFINLNRTKSGERRQIPINDTLQEMLRGIVRRVDVPWVFYDPETGKRFRDVKRSFSTACRKAGITDFVFHGLRHTFASHLVMAGVDLTTVSRLMGHKSLVMTLRYSHLAPGHLASAVNVLDSTMGGISTNLAQEKNKGLRSIA